MGQDKTMQGEDKDPILWPRPAPLPSLVEKIDSNMLGAKLYKKFNKYKSTFYNKK